MNNFFPTVFEAFANAKIAKLEKQATDILILSGNLKGLRVAGEVIITDESKVIERLKDVYPSNPARASFQIINQLKLVDRKEKKAKAIWTCGFRDSEKRWVWYKNSEPQMTVSFNEAHIDGDFEKAVDFCLASFGTETIEQIKKEGLKKVAKRLNALVLENPYTKIACEECHETDNYTIDDLVDTDKNAKYDSNYVICNNCNHLIALI